MSTAMPAIRYDAKRKVYYNAEDGRVLTPESIELVQYGKTTMAVAIHPVRYVVAA